MVDTCIIGGGLAGLACALELDRAGLSFQVLDADDRPGGRVQTDLFEGYRLDRGFQILLAAYPEAQRVLDYAALDLRDFEPGALVHARGGLHRMSDPLRRPGQALQTLLAPIGTLSDKIRLGLLSLSLRRGRARDLLHTPDGSTLEALREAGFSDGIIDGFLRPFVGGIQLDPDLEVSRRRFAIIFRMLSVGAACLPAKGMGQIPAQLAARLPGGSLRSNTVAERIEGTTVHLTTGESIAARTVVVATEGAGAARLLDIPKVPGRPASCMYFTADTPPFEGPLLVLEGETGPAKNLIVPSNLSREYAPTGRALIAAALPGSLADGAPGISDDEDGAVHALRRQLRGWFGEAVDGWQHLRTYRIEHAHPDQRPPFEPKKPVSLDGGLYVCGDHRDTASIQGALFSGWRTARAVARDLGEVPRADSGREQAH